MPLSELEELELLELEELEYGQTTAPQPPTEQSLLQRAEDIYARRAANIGQVTGGAYPEQTIGEDVLQVGGQVAGGAGELIGEGIMAAGRGIAEITPEAIKEPVTEFFTGAGEDVSESGIGKLASEAIQGGVESWDAFKQENPRAARDVESVVNVGMIFPVAQVAGKGAVAAGKAAAPKVSAAAKGTVKLLSREKPVTMDNLKKLTTSAYDAANEAAEKAGTTIKAGKLKQRFNFNTRKEFAKVGGALDERVHPYASQGLGIVNESLAGKSITPLKLENTRRLLNDIIKKSKDMGKETPDTIKLYSIKGSLDDVIDNIGDKDLIKGNADFLGKFQEARRVNTIKSKLSPLDKIFRDAEFHAKNTSYEQTLKQGFVRLVKSDRLMKNYTAAEKKMIQNAAKTGNIEGLFNKFGVFSPTSGKLGAAISGGTGVGIAAGGNPLFVALPIAGAASKAASDKIARQKAKKAFKGIAEQVKGTK